MHFVALRWGKPRRLCICMFVLRWGKPRRFAFVCLSLCCAGASPGALDVVPRVPLGLILSTVLTIRFVAYFCYYSSICLIKENIICDSRKQTQIRLLNHTRCVNTYILFLFFSYHRSARFHRLSFPSPHPTAAH